MRIVVILHKYYIIHHTILLLFEIAREERNYLYVVCVNAPMLCI